jgi:sulfite reductase (NADPH) flavoprotein alpha-component
VEAVSVSDHGQSGTVDRVEARTVTVLFGTETGNSSEIANAIVRDVNRIGLDASAHDMAGFDVAALEGAEDVLVVVSTFGEGDPPQPAWRFFETIEGDGAPVLEGVRYSVCALGDSSYEFYCEAGKRLDRRFEALGAKRLLARVDCDIDYEENSALWSAGVLERLSESASTLVLPSAAESDDRIDDRHTDRHHTAPVTIIRNDLLTGAGSSKRTRHLELSLADTGLVYQPGDALGIVARNSPDVVDALLQALDLRGDDRVERGGAQVSLQTAFEGLVEITTATPRLLNFWAIASGSGALQDLTAPNRGRERTAFLHAHHVVDLVRLFPAKSPDPQAVVDALRALQPRLYSIASSLTAVPDEVHLTVATVDYELHGERRWGVTSGQLANDAPPGTGLEVYVHESPHFRLPADDVPIIMVGAGTGVAPYRGFLQERQTRGASGGAMLFFGERNAATDYLYRDDWDAFRRQGILSEMEVAFSRDGAAKVYVQHRMSERSAEIFAWLEKGAHVYVCGDAIQMAPDVHAMLVNIASRGLGRGAEAGEEYVHRLTAEHRYHRDVY